MVSSEVIRYELLRCLVREMRYELVEYLVRVMRYELPRF